MQFHEEQEPYGDIGGYSEEFEEQLLPGQKKRSPFRSIPLRTHQQPKAGQVRNTTRSYAIPDVQGTRAPIMRPAQAQAQKQQSYVSRQQMPARPQGDELYHKPNPNSTRREVVRATPTSIAHYTDNQGRDVYEQNNRRIIHKSKPPRRFHLVFWLGLGMLLMILLWIAGQAAIGAIQQHNIDSTYGFPRTYQTDAVVGHGDSTLHPSHFIFLNLQGHIEVIEICGGDPSRSIIYAGPQIYDQHADQFPVTGKFDDRNHDGLPDMEISVNGQTIVFLNNGKKFVPQS